MEDPVENLAAPRFEINILVCRFDQRVSKKTEIITTLLCYFPSALRISFALSKVARQLSSGWPCL